VEFLLGSYTYSPDRDSVVCKLGPYELAAFRVSCFAAVALPKILTIILLALHDRPESHWHATFTAWTFLRTEFVSVEAIGDVNPSKTQIFVGLNGTRGLNGMLPLFLHFCVHDEKRIVR